MFISYRRCLLRHFGTCKTKSKIQKQQQKIFKKPENTTKTKQQKPASLIVLLLGFFLTQKKGPFDLLRGNLHFIFPNFHGKLNFQHLQHSLLQRKLPLGACKDMSVILLIVLKSFIVGNGVKESEVNMRKGKVIFQPKKRINSFLKKSCTVLYQRFKKNCCIKKFLQKFLPKTKIKKFQVE